MSPTNNLTWNALLLFSKIKKARFELKYQQVALLMTTYYFISVTLIVQFMAHQYPIPYSKISSLTSSHIIPYMPKAIRKGSAINAAKKPMLQIIIDNQ